MCFPDTKKHLDELTRHYRFIHAGKGPKQLHHSIVVSLHVSPGQ